MEQKSAKDRDLVITGNGSAIGGEYRRVRITGEAAVDGNLSCDRLKAMGQIDVEGDLHSEEVKVLGELSVKGNCASEFFQVRGTFQIGGLLNSEKIEVRLFGPCEVKEIGGGHIRIKRNLPGKSDYKHLRVDTVEGDDIHLECTRAKVVRGNRVKIESGCDIDLVEYRDDFRQSAHANVKESKRV